jgi:uncharacterized protein YuzE
MKVIYDAETDTLTVLLRDASTATSEEERSGVILDYEQLIALEILDASTRVDGVDTVQLQVIARPNATHPKAAE